ncbi:MAG: hypothetical protein WDA22_03335 [Bacteroidota bacterium]
MDKRIYIIAALATLGLILSFVRETQNAQSDTFSLMPSSTNPISGDRVYRMADTTLRSFGLKKENIRPIKNRNDVRVFIPSSFDPILFVRAMKDSLESFEAQIISFENAKEKTSIVQIKNKEVILKSFIFSKEPVTVVKKGVSSSLPKKQTR